jgi:hypothetical protein
MEGVAALSDQDEAMIPWAVLITGAVGIGGTALGAWLNGRTQTKTLQLSISAENERAQLARKRQMYADCMTAFTAVIFTIAVLEQELARKKESSQDAQAQYQKAVDATFTALAALELGAPREVSSPALKLKDKLVELSSATLGRESTDSIGGQIPSLRKDLKRAMRADLGEPDEDTAN